MENHRFFWSAAAWVALSLLAASGCGDGPVETTPDAGDPPELCGNGVIDGDEACDSDGCCNATCDGPAAAGTECRPAAAACDVAERCDGTATACPSDVVAEAGTECRTAVDGCDVAERCDGAQASCPEDERAPDDLACAECVFGDGGCLCLAGVCEPVSGLVVINEIDPNTPAIDMVEDTAEFIELYDGGVGDVALDGLILAFVNGSNDVVNFSLRLDGERTDDDGYFVVGALDADPDYQLRAGDIQNGPEGVILYRSDDASLEGIPADDLDQSLIVDAVVYGPANNVDSGLIADLTPGQTQLDEAGAGDPEAYSLQRVPDGGGGLRRSGGFVLSSPTPGAPNQAAQSSVRSGSRAGD